MASRQNSGRTTKGGGNAATGDAPQAGAPAEATAPGAVPEILETIRDLESQLNGISAMQSQAETREVDLRERATLLQRRESELTEQAKTLSKREQEVQKMTAALEKRARQLDQKTKEDAASAQSREGRLEKRSASIEKDRRELDGVRESAEATERALAQLEEELKANATALDERARAIEASEQDLAAAQASREAEVSDRAAQVEAQIASIEAERAAIASEREAIETMRSEAEAAMAEREASLAGTIGELEQREREVGEALQHAEAQAATVRSEAEAAGSELRAQATSELEAERARLEAEARERDEQMAGRNAELERQAEELAQRIAEFGLAREEFEQSRSGQTEAHEQLEAQRQELELVRVDLHEREEHARKQCLRVSDLERELANLREALSTSAGSSQNAVAEAKSEATALMKRAEEAERTVAQIEERAGRAEQRVMELEESLATSSQDESARASELQSALESIEREKAAMAAELEAARANLAEAGDGADASVAIAKRDEAIRILKDRLNQAEQGVGGRPMAPAEVEQRRNRLRHYKRLLHGEAQKIIQAQEALRKRREEGERILAERQKLIKLSKQLTRRKKKIESAKVRNGAIAAVFFVTATIGIVAALSWAISGEIRPGEFVASAMIEAETRGRGVDEGDLEAWQMYHEQLVMDDPQLVEMTAERMKARGIEELGEPGDLRARLKSDLYTHSERHGRLMLELRGKGGDRTSRELDTYVTTLVSRANEARGKRGDGIATKITAVAAASETPLDHERVKTAGMILGGGATAAILLGSVIWTRLSRSKREFEKQEERELAIDEIDWEPPAE